MISRTNCFGITDKGLCRTSNQDSFVIEEKDGCLMGVVCDGIGGGRAGDVASAMAADIMAEQFVSLFDRSQPKQQWLMDTVNLVNISVYQKGLEDDNCAGMGTTLVAFIADEQETVVINVGDSRCYQLSGGQLFQVSEDHTLVNEMVKYRGFDYELASSLVGRNVISRAIGVNEVIEGDCFQLKDYQYLLLCSDGLHGYVEEDLIRDCLLDEHSDLAGKAARMVEMANQAGGWDNVTAVIMRGEEHGQ